MTFRDILEPEEREVKEAEGRRLALQFSCPFVSVSSKTGENVDRILPSSFEFYRIELFGGIS